MTRQPTDLPPPRWQRLLQWGAILWPSFVAAGVATVVFFGFVDPLRLRDISFPGQTISRELGYTLGFFMFWGLAAGSSAVTWYLQRPPRREDDDEVPLG